jgi:hypothetical protein
LYPLWFSKLYLNFPDAAQKTILRFSFSTAQKYKSSYLFCTLIHHYISLPYLLTSTWTANLSALPQVSKTQQCNSQFIFLQMQTRIDQTEEES